MITHDGKEYGTCQAHLPFQLGLECFQSSVGLKPRQPGFKATLEFSL